MYDRNGNIKFKTIEEKEKYSDPYIDLVTEKTPWNLPESRVIIRRDYRNNLNNIINGRCISYGALTVEATAVHFIREGKIKFDIGDTVVVYSDGFSPLLNTDDFIKQMLNFNKISFENYIDEISKSNCQKYGKEKTLVIMK